MAKTCSALGKNTVIMHKCIETIIQSKLNYVKEKATSLSTVEYAENSAEALGLL